MRDEKKGDSGEGNQKPINGFEKRFNNWVAKQSSPVQATVTTVKLAAITFGETARGTLRGCDLHQICKELCALPLPSSKLLRGCGEYKPLVKFLLVGDDNEQFRNFAIASAASASICCVMKSLSGGKEDVHTSMVASFGYGVVLSIVTGMRGPRVISVSVVFALFNCGMFKLRGEIAAGDELHGENKGSM